MCGIFGYVSNDAVKIDSNAFKILGIMNESRGEQSCGVAIDSEIFHGVTDSDKKFRNFIKGVDLQPKERPILLGHTRKASVGVVNIDNAHPFGFGTNKIDRGYAFIGAHNGTLYNHEELAEKFHVELQEEKSNNTVRNKIDSEVLLESLYLSKSYKPLSFYNGGAALAWYVPDTNTTYLFSGESKAYDISGVTSVERPLHVLIIDDNTFAFSSEGEPLEMIGGAKTDIFQIETNTVHVIKNGDFKNAKKVKISRANNTNKKETTTNYGHGFNSQRRLPFNNSTPSTTIKQTVEDYTAQRTQNSSSANSSPTDRGTMFDCFGDIIPTRPALIAESKGRSITTHNSHKLFVDINDLKGRVYFKEGRFYKNGHKLETGVYFYIPGYGLYKAGNTKQEAIEYITKNKENYFDIAEVLICSKEARFSLSKPLASERYVKYPVYNKWLVFTYVFEGFPLKDELDYVAILSNTGFYKSAHNIYDYNKISHMSLYPIKCESGVNYSKYIREGEPYNGTIAGPCIESIHTVENGHLKRLTELPKPNLAGIDILNKIEYQKKLDKYTAQYKENVKKAEEASEAAEQEETTDTLSSLRKNLTSASGEDALDYTSTISIYDEIGDDLLEAFLEYEDDCFAARCDVGIETFINSCRIIASSYRYHLDEIIFDVCTSLENRRKRELEAGKRSVSGSITATIKSLLNYETQN